MGFLGKTCHSTHSYSLPDTSVEGCEKYTLLQLPSGTRRQPPAYVSLEESGTEEVLTGNPMVSQAAPEADVVVISAEDIQAVPEGYQVVNGQDPPTEPNEFNNDLNNDLNTSLNAAVDKLLEAEEEEAPDDSVADVDFDPDKETLSDEVSCTRNPKVS